MTEQWKEIPNFPQYEASTLGNVRNIKTKRLLAKYQTNLGYERLTLRQNGKYVSIDVHRLIALTFIPNPEEKKTVNHINRVKNDNRLENLEWATVREQNLHVHATTSESSYGRSSFLPEEQADDVWKPTRYNNILACRRGFLKNAKTNKMIRIQKDGRGYCYVRVKNACVSVHRIVAEAFLPKFCKSLVVNHIDSNTSNNHVDNLECVTQSQNILHAYATGSLVKKKKTTVLQVDYLSNIVGSYESLAAAEAATGFNRGNIHRGIHESIAARGFRWFKSYADYEKAKPTIFASIFKVFQYNMDGSLEGVYNDYVDVEAQTGIAKANINRAVNRNKTSLLTTGGYIWTTTQVPKTELLEALRNNQISLSDDD